MFYRCDTCSSQHTVYCLNTIGKADINPGSEALTDQINAQIMPFCLA